MKALTLWQPWATLIVLGPKRIENRTWLPSTFLIGQRIAIHAGKRCDGHAVLDHEETLVRILGGYKDLPSGAILGTARLVGTTRHSTDPWFTGPVGWILDDVRPLSEPLPCKGAQGFWNIPMDVFGKLECQSYAKDFSSES